MLYFYCCMFLKCYFSCNTCIFMKTICVVNYCFLVVFIVISIYIFLFKFLFINLLCLVIIVVVFVKKNNQQTICWCCWLFLICFISFAEIAFCVLERLWRRRWSLDIYRLFLWRHWISNFQVEIGLYSRKQIWVSRLRWRMKG